MMNGTGNNAAAKTVNLELTVDEANLVLAGLGELPAKLTLGVITKIQNQAASQLQAEEAVAASAANQPVN